MFRLDQVGESDFQGACAELAAMRAHIPDIIGAPLVGEFNDIVDRLQRWSGDDLSRFRVADSELRRVSRLSYMSNFYTEAHKKVHGPPECEPDLFLRRVDGLLMYLQVRNRTGKPAIGFAPRPVR
jgi:hypothetical protein